MQEYWLFDPRGEWLDSQLQGYRLRGEVYEPITDGCSKPLQLCLVVEGELIGCYRQDTGEKLLIPSELAERLLAESQARQQVEALLKQERQRAEQEYQRAERLARYLRQQGIDPDSI